MSLKEAVKEFETMLRDIEKYQTPFDSSVEAFLQEYGVDFEPYPMPRPKVKGISSSAVIREIREDRW